MPNKFDPMEGGTPTELEQAREPRPTETTETEGRGSLFEGSTPVADVTYVATVVEKVRPADKVTAPIMTGHGVLEPVEEGALDTVDLTSNQLILHFEDGRSTPIMIDERSEEGAYPFTMGKR